MNKPSGALQIPRNLLFRYKFNLKPLANDAKSPNELGPEFRIPSFGRFEGQVTYADWRGAWSESGLYFTVSVANKERSLWCKPNQLLESDCFQVWIDTRDTQTVHRATRYCHWLAAMPSGGTGKTEAMALMLKINRAKEDSPSMNRAKLAVESSLTKSGYELRLFVPGGVLNGWDPSENPRIGIFLSCTDQEFGSQTLSVSDVLPCAEDPSLWCTANLEGS